MRNSGVYDTKVKTLTVGFIDRVLQLELENFYANFDGLVTNHPGEVSGTLTFTGISNLCMDLEPLASPDEIPWIYDLEVTATAERGVNFNMSFSPAGRITGTAKTFEISEVAPDRFSQTEP